MNKDRDLYFDDLVRDVNNFCEPEILSAEDPLFILIPLDLQENLKVLCILLVDI